MKKALKKFIIEAFFDSNSSNPTQMKLNASKKNFCKLNFMKFSPIKFLFAFTLIFAFSVVSFAQDSGSEDVYFSDRKLKIIEMPSPKLTEEQSKENICVQGQVVRRVEFLSNNEIGNVAVVRPLSHGLTENALEAAKKIKFEPEIKDGMATTVFKLVQYNFKWGWLNTPEKK